MTKKSISSRIKFTKTGKLIRRKMGLGHNRAKKSSRQLQRKAKLIPIHYSDIKTFKKYL